MVRRKDTRKRGYRERGPRKGRTNPNHRTITFIDGPKDGTTGTYIRNPDNGHIMLNLGRDKYVYNGTRPTGTNEQHHEYKHQPNP